MSSAEIRQLYLDFFKGKNHAVIPSASLIPENDPTTLFAGSGMQPMIPYLLGEKHPLGKRITDSQKCFRAQDIDEVGDNRHTTFFEMLGNWSLGDYFKKEQIPWIFEFLTKTIGLNPQNIYVTVFRGNEKLGLPRDEESVKIWQELFEKAGIKAEAVDSAEKNGMGNGRIFYYDEKKNWWSRSGIPEQMPIGEPGGPDSEMFWDFGPELKLHENSEFKNGPCHVNCDCGRFLEIGNNVFMEYVKKENGFELLPQKNVDFGGGLERFLAANNNNSDIFSTDLFWPIISKLEELSGKKYSESVKVKRAMRITADHVKAAVFMLAEGLEPSNTGRGYILRRLVRRAVRHGKNLGIKENFTFKISESIIGIYMDIYPELDKNKDFIENHLIVEEEKFAKTFDIIELYRNDLEQAIKYNTLKKIKDVPILSSRGIASGRYVYENFQSYGVPFEASVEIIKGLGLEFDKKEYDDAFKKHQDLSRTASAGQFKGGLADTNEQTIKYHTAAHLMLAALRKVLNGDVVQRGSNITAERLRFDFSHGEKLTPEQIKQVEDLVNEKIKADLPVVCEEMSLEEAKNKGAMGVFDSKYGERVKVYTIGESPSTSSGSAFSREICGGPHVNRTSELGVFKITKEESASAGVRRIKAVLE